MEVTEKQDNLEGPRASMDTESESRRKVYCFGNADLEEDSIPLDLAEELDEDPELKGRFCFIRCTSPDFLLNLSVKEADDIIIIDTVKGLDSVEVIEDLDRLKDTKTTTAHDFDLGTVLKLMKEAGEIRRVIVIGVPDTLKSGIKGMVRAELLRERSKNTPEAKNVKKDDA
ncbi:MAG: hypothetical protein R6U32_01070 [Candidatus Woesearchaeota archaeon]